VSHGEFLRKAIDEDVTTVKQVQQDPAQAATLTDQEKVMLTFVEKMTKESWTMTRRDVEGLRTAGFSEVQILAIVQLTAWFNFMTRVADALGVEVEEWRGAWRQELLPDTAALEAAR
jgi:uncharacterized peroxidase-related enzyme